jgi:hypothetical protein
MLASGVNAQETLSYKGYQISITRPSAINRSVVTVKKGGRILAIHRAGISTEYGSSAELISLLGSNRKQLVISQYTGGAHCCNRYWIYELTPRFRLLFRSQHFDTIGYSEAEKLFQNIDSDSDLEIVDRSPAFHYFDGLAFVSSPQPTLIFDYNRRTRKFEVGNRRFANYLLKDQAASIAESQTLRTTNQSQHRVDSLVLFLNCVYAGKEQIGWKYYHREKALSDWRKFFHKDRVIKRTLKSDPAYRAIYPK